MNQANVINSEIKALLMLVLLKGGTRAEEIQTALQMAALSNLHHPEQDFAEQPDLPTQRTPAQATAQASAQGQNKGIDENRLHRITPKQVLRNSYLAPIKGYAA